MFELSISAAIFLFFLVASLAPSSPIKNKGKLV